MIKLQFEEIEYTLYVINKKNYKQFEPILETLLICDKSYISNILETSIYTSIEDGNMVGFFLIDSDNRILCSMVLDKKCRQYGDVIVDHGYSIKHSIELTLLCANHEHRVKGLTLFFVKYIIKHLVPLVKENVQDIFLYVAKGEKNTRAYSFYKKLGFTTVFGHHMVYHI